MLRGMQTPRGKNQSFALEEKEASFNCTQAAPRSRLPSLGSCPWCCWWCRLDGQRQHFKPFLCVASSSGGSQQHPMLWSLPISPDPQTECLPFHPNTFTCPVLLASLPPSYQLSLPSSYSSFTSQGKHHLLRKGDQSLPTSCPHSSTSSPSQPPLIFNYLEVCKWLFAQFRVNCLPTKLCEERDQVFLVHCCIPSPQHRTWHRRAQRLLVGDDCFLVARSLHIFMGAAGNVPVCWTSIQTEES